MRPPIPAGTVLQDRYRILSVLGQGGFGRTYLAEDQGRFSELCALKELTPADTGAYALEKSKELFQREAQILYQIQHPQIPQFRATFEYEQRLFLVQDYVEGQTYRKLLDQRRSQGYAFSEAEVKQLFLQLLPVLAYIHSKGIIHRDITPDNIILRAQDHLPVLIDFGVVKELATKFQSPVSLLPNATALQNTTVGKLGYAPIEQIQTGRAYSSSDLYSLAVTAVVLLTGREPQELLDDATMTWYWQRWVRVDPGFAQVISRMLSYRPGDRYQSAIDVLEAMQFPPPTVQPQTVPPVYQPAAYQSPPDSRVPTMAVGREPVQDSLLASRPEPVIERTRSSIWDDPLAVTAIGIGMVMLTGIGSWAIVRAVLNPSSPNPVPTETQTITPSPSATATFTPKPPSPKPTPEPATYSQRLDIAPDTRLVQNGTLGANETINYIVSAQQGQQLSVAIGGEGVLMTVLGPNRQPLSQDSQRVSYWQGTLPYSGDYYIQLKPVKGLDRSDYRLDVNLKNTPQPSPDPTFSPSPSPTIDTQRVQFPSGTTGTTVSDRSNPSVTKRYLVNARRGQILSVRVLNGSVTLNIRYPGGRLVEGAANVLSWESELPRGGDYKIDVIATQDTNFQLDVNVRDLAQQGDQGTGNTGGGWLGKWVNGWFGRGNDSGRNAGNGWDRNRNSGRWSDTDSGRWPNKDRNSNGQPDKDRDSGHWPERGKNSTGQTGRDRSSGRWSDRNGDAGRWTDRNRDSNGQPNRDRTSDRWSDRNRDSGSSNGQNNGDHGRWADRSGNTGQTNRDRTSDRWSDRNRDAGNSNGRNNGDHGRWADRSGETGQTNRDRTSGRWPDRNRDSGSSNGQNNGDRGRWTDGDLGKQDQRKPSEPNTSSL